MIPLSESKKLCPICRKETVSKIKSHLMPQWATRTHLGKKDDNLKEINLKQKKIFRPKQKRGKFEKFLLCENCESDTAELDGYASQYFKNSVNENSSFKKIVDSDKPPVLLFKIDHFKIKKFIISIILRYYYAVRKSEKHNMFDNLLDIPDKHIECLRVFFNKKEFEENDLKYATTFIYFYNLNKIFKYHYIAPTKARVCKMWCMSFNIGEYHFVQFVSSHISVELKNKLRKQLPNLPEIILNNISDEFLCLPRESNSLENHFLKEGEEIKSKNHFFKP